MKHTPGPWEITKNNHTRFVFVGTPERHYPLFKDDPDYPNQEDWANARLIAKAPKLAKALKGLILWTRTTAMYHLKDEELLPKGLEKWEALLEEII